MATIYNPAKLSILNLREIHVNYGYSEEQVARCTDKQILEDFDKPVNVTKWQKVYWEYFGYG